VIKLRSIAQLPADQPADERGHGDEQDEKTEDRGTRSPKKHVFMGIMAAFEQLTEKMVKQVRPPLDGSCCLLSVPKA
jgi:hypothetical protein